MRKVNLPYGRDTNKRCSFVASTLRANRVGWSFPPLSGIQGLIAGVDEVGRGALFGPVVAAAVILTRSCFARTDGSWN